MRRTAHGAGAQITLVDCLAAKRLKGAAYPVVLGCGHRVEREDTACRWARVRERQNLSPRRYCMQYSDERLPAMAVQISPRRHCLVSNANFGGRVSKGYAIVLPATQAEPYGLRGCRPPTFPAIKLNSLPGICDSGPVAVPRRRPGRVGVARCGIAASRSEASGRRQLVPTDQPYDVSHRR